MTTATETLAAQPLTQLSEEEQMFQESVRDFAIEKIRPLVPQMDHDAKMDPSLISSFFELGIMGIEVPDQWGGAGSSFFNAVLVVEELSHVDASCGVLVDVQNTLVNNAILRWGNEDQKSKYFPMLTRDTVGAYALSEAGSGSDAFGLACKAEEKGDHWILKLCFMLQTLDAMQKKVLGICFGHQVYMFSISTLRPSLYHVEFNAY